MYLEDTLTVSDDEVNTVVERQTFIKDGASIFLAQLADGRLYSLRWGRLEEGQVIRGIGFD